MIGGHIVVVAIGDEASPVKNADWLAKVLRNGRLEGFRRDVH